MIIDHILEPLRKTHNIDYFTHCTYSNNKCSLVSSDSKAAVQFISDSTSMMPIDVSNNPSELLSWEEYCSTDYMNFITERHKGEKNGVTFVLRHSKSQAEHITLHSSNSEVSLKAYLTSNKCVSSNIIRHIRNCVFMSKQKPQSIQFDSKHKINKSKKTLIMQQEDMSHFKKFFIIGKKGETHLTKKELECIKHLMQLKTTNLLSTDLNLHKKTVESHIASARKKLGVKSRNELYEVVCQNLIHIPPMTSSNRIN